MRTRFVKFSAAIASLYHPSRINNNNEILAKAV